MKMHLKKSILSSMMLPAFLLLGMAACGSFEREINLNLPSAPSQLVVECFLEDGKPYRLLLTETVDYLAPPTLPDVRDALVIITHNGLSDTLIYAPFIDEENNKIYNYVAKRTDQVVDIDAGGVYDLRIVDGRGRTITASTRFLPFTPIEEISWEFEDARREIKDDSARALLLVRYPLLDNEPHFRIVIKKDSANAEPEVDFVTRSTFATNNLVTIGTAYRFLPDDTVYVTLYRLEKPHYDYLRSIDQAISANGNPFGQPAVILSAVQGGIGIFAAWNFDQQRVVIVKENSQ
jgi:hypothetical protein